MAWILLFFAGLCDALDEEVTWLLALHRRLSLIADNRGTSRPRAERGPSRSPLADPALVEQCQQLVGAWLHAASLDRLAGHDVCLDDDQRFGSSCHPVYGC